MFDYHLHTAVSFDSTATAREIAEAALQRGLKEICFTDHHDHGFTPEAHHDLFSLEAYSAAYDGLQLPGLKIRRGMEYGMTTWNVPHLKELLQKRSFDFVIGSLHYADGSDPYFKEFWEGRTMQQAFTGYLEQTLRCVQLHDDYDVLGHLNYVCKSPHSPTHEPLFYQDYRELCDEIMKVLVQKGKGMEINTSGVDRAGVYLPDAEFLKRFKELGGEIVTVGSDAHDASRVGQYVPEALGILKDIFGYVCTFEARKPIFRKL